MADGQDAGKIQVQAHASAQGGAEGEAQVSGPLKDWAGDAAEELASFFSFGSGPDSYVTDEQRAEVARGYLEVIAKHCPFKKDVAYMPVPRCETCSHFVVLRPGYGTRCTDLNMPTVESFGCTHWKAKNAALPAEPTGGKLQRARAGVDKAERPEPGRPGILGLPAALHSF